MRAVGTNECVSTNGTGKRGFSECESILTTTTDNPKTPHKWYNMKYINMSGNLPMGSAYPPRPLAEPRSGCYAGCKRAAGEVFGCIPHGCAGEAKLRREAARSAPEGTARGRARALR